MGTRTRIVAGAVALAVLAACSGGSDDAAATETTAAAVATTTTAVAEAPAGDGGLVAPIGRSGRWFVDGLDRVVQLRGVNEVYKSDPWYPAADGFGADDAAFLVEHGFNTVRLGVNFEGLMPEPGQIDEAYLDGIATSVTDLADAGLFVLLDFHQDGFSPKYNGNGFPDWLALDDDLANPDDAVFPLYYIQNPAMQRAFESFWANREGPDGVGVQDHFVAGVTAVAERFADEEQVVGYEVINEPFPGLAYEPCLTPAGCAELEQTLIAPFAAKVVDAVRAVTDTQLVAVEPFVLFNFGQGPTSLPGADTDLILATHSYALEPAAEDAVVDFTVDAAERDGAPALITEFGASTDPTLLRRLTTGFDRRMLPWLFWAYNENVITDREGDAGMDRLASEEAFRELVRPYPEAVAGTPESFGYDPERQTFELVASTVGPGGEAYPEGVETVIVVPRLAYPTGYAVDVVGGTVTSEPCATDLTIATDPGEPGLQVTITPAEDCP